MSAKTKSKVFKTDIKPEKPDEKPTKIEKWDWNAVKNALDDGTRKFLTSQDHFVEDHRLMNVRLIISTFAIIFSGIAIVYDYLHPFPLSRDVMILCVVSYFITVSILTYYITYVERGCSVAAKQLDEAGIDKPILWRVYSNMKRYDENYLLDVEYENLNNRVSRKSTFKSSVGNYFDENGTFLLDKLYQDLANHFEKLTQTTKDK